MSEKMNEKIKKMLLEAVLLWNSRPFDAKRLCEQAILELNRIPVCKGICYEEKP